MNHFTSGVVEDFQPTQPEDNPMKSNLKQNRSSKNSQNPTSLLQEDIFRRIGEMGSVVVEGKVIDLDQFFGTANAIEESADESFDKTAHDFELEADEYLQIQTGPSSQSASFR
jgi:hypothetical protein